MSSNVRGSKIQYCLPYTGRYYSLPFFSFPPSISLLVLLIIFSSFLPSHPSTSLSSYSPPPSLPSHLPPSLLLPPPSSSFLLLPSLSSSSLPTLLSSLQTSGKLMELGHRDGKLRVHYGDKLVTLLREVRQLSSLGFTIPNKIQQTANTAQKFYRHGVILKQVQWVIMKKTPQCMSNCVDKSCYTNESIFQFTQLLNFMLVLFQTS